MTITSDDLYHAEQAGNISLELSAHVKGTIRVLKEESAFYQARLTLARDLIAVLSHNGMMPENLMTDNGAAWRKWRDEEMKK